MKCPVCRHGETKPGRATVTLERGDTTLVFKDVPAEVCGNCGEAFHSEEVTRALLAQAEDAARAGVEVDVRRYAAA
jgi:YgiT-type zinc finger domain-containing protein